MSGALPSSAKHAPLAWQPSPLASSTALTTWWCFKRSGVKALTGRRSSLALRLRFHTANFSTRKLRPALQILIHSVNQRCLWIWSRDTLQVPLGIHSYTSLQLERSSCVCSARRLDRSKSSWVCDIGRGRTGAIRRMGDTCMYPEGLFCVAHLSQTVAAGGEDGPESRLAHRITQAYELASFAKQSAAKGRHVICVRN